MHLLYILATYAIFCALFPVLALHRKTRNGFMERFEAAAVRWAGRLALEVKDLKLSELVGAIESLIALPDENAQRSLLALTQRATRPPGITRSPVAARRSQQGRRRGLGS